MSARIPVLPGSRRAVRTARSNGRPRRATASGDRIDIVFERRSLRLAVEVKPFHAPEGDMLRVFQCLKYQAALTAEAALADEAVETRVLLILGGSASDDVISVANRLGIPLRDNVRFAGDRSGAS